MSLRHHVEVLPAGHLGTHRLDDRQRPLQSRLVQAGAVQHLGRPHHQQVAEQDRAGLAEGGRITKPAGVGVQRLELPMGGRPPAAQVGGVHQVVVDQSTNVQDVKAARGGEQWLELDVCRHSGSSDVAPYAEGGPHPLASAQHLAGHQMHRDQLGSHRIEHR